LFYSRRAYAFLTNYLLTSSDEGYSLLSSLSIGEAERSENVPFFSWKVFDGVERYCFEAAMQF